MKWISGLVFFISIASYPQETKFILKKGKGFNEEYYVSVTDHKTKNGTYVKYKNDFSGISLLEVGNYRDGKKDGLWEFYYDVSNTILRTKNRSNSLKERGHFVSDKKNGVWVSYYLDTIPNKIFAQKYGQKKKMDSVSIYVDQNDLRTRLAGQFLNDKKVGEWVSFDYAGKIYQRYNFTNSTLILDKSISDSLTYNRDRTPLYIGGLPCLIDDLAHGFNFRPIAESMKKDSSTVIVSLLITKDGKIGEIDIFQSNAPSSMEKEVVRLITLLGNNWIPALGDSNFITSNYKIGFDIIRKKSENVSSFQVSYRVIK